MSIPRLAHQRSAMQRRLRAREYLSQEILSLSGSRGCDLRPAPHIVTSRLPLTRKKISKDTMVVTVRMEANAAAVP